ncbi:hypothetical protein ElyMa_001112300 [Elysia marginata]|uniref:Uncharacterized protein n=1 Tax=Elysia marginata TaxID=1093978 RepID=A0AAV4HX16_9GAST|nr:hypothetical protein ElyMa_001112300 [Elysia marginata]
MITVTNWACDKLDAPRRKDSTRHTQQIDGRLPPCLTKGAGSFLQVVAVRLPFLITAEWSERQLWRTEGYLYSEPSSRTTVCLTVLAIITWPSPAVHRETRL